MPKRRLSAIAKDYDVSWEVAEKAAYDHLDENMISGSGYAKWVTESGQAVLDEVLPMPRLLRGKVRKQMPNKSYVGVYCADLCSMVGVKLPRKLEGKMMNKMIYFTESQENGEAKYFWQPTPSNG